MFRGFGIDMTVCREKMVALKLRRNRELENVNIREFK